MRTTDHHGCSHSIVENFDNPDHYDYVIILSHNNASRRVFILKKSLSKASEWFKILCCTKMQEGQFSEIVLEEPISIMYSVLKLACSNSVGATNFTVTNIFALLELADKYQFVKLLEKLVDIASSAIDMRTALQFENSNDYLKRIYAKFIISHNNYEFYSCLWPDKFMTLFIREHRVPYEILPISMPYRRVNSGCTYIGDHSKKGIPHGYGIYNENSLTYTGEFSEGKFHGKGVLQCKCRSILNEFMLPGNSHRDLDDVLIGTWQNGIMQGPVVHTWKDAGVAHKFLGTLVNSERQGPGYLIADYGTLRAVWENGDMADTLGALHLPSGWKTWGSCAQLHNILTSEFRKYLGLVNNSYLVQLERTVQEKKIKDFKKEELKAKNRDKYQKRFRK